MDSSADQHFCDFSGTSEKGIYKETNQSFSRQMDSSADLIFFIFYFSDTPEKEIYKETN